MVSGVPFRHYVMGLAQHIRRFTSSHTACNQCHHAAQSYALVWKKLRLQTFLNFGEVKYYHKHFYSKTGKMQ